MPPEEDAKKYICVAHDSGEPHAVTVGPRK